MEIAALILAIVASALLIRNFFLSEKVKKLHVEISRLRRDLEESIEALIERKEEDEGDEEEIEIAVGSHVTITLGSFLVRGTISSVAASNKSGKRGFSFIADKDKNSLWLPYDYNMWLSSVNKTFEGIDKATKDLDIVKKAKTNKIHEDFVKEAEAAVVPEDSITAAIASARGQDA